MTSWSLVSDLQKYEPLFPSHLGWLVDRSNSRVSPAIRLGHQTWTSSTPFMDPKGARARFEKKIYHDMAHFISHDMNGKIMGLDGILSYIQEAGAASAAEDLQMVRTSLEPLRLLTVLFSWFPKEDPKYDRVINAKELNEIFSVALPRYFKPLNSFRFQTNEKISLLASPFLVAFWFAATAIALSALKKEGEIIPFSFASIDDPRSLVFKTQCDAFEKALNGETQPSEVFWDWMMLFAHQNGSWKKANDQIELTIPLQGFFSTSAFLELKNISLEQAAPLLIQNLFGLRVIAVEKSSSILIDLVASIREIQLIGTA